MHIIFLKKKTRLNVAAIVQCLPRPIVMWDELSLCILAEIGHNVLMTGQQSTWYAIKTHDI